MIKRQKYLSIGEAFGLFKASKITINPITVSNYEMSFDLFLRDNNIDEDFPLKKVTESFLVSWVSSCDRTLSAKNHHLGSMRVFLYWCMKHNYMSSYKIELIKGQEPVIKYYTDEDIEKLVKKPSSSDLFSQYRTWVAICFVLATGARASTLINIKISDIDFQNNEIIYRHLKNRQVAVIPLSKSLEKVLKEYLASWNREKEDGWLFCDACERQSTVSALHQALDNYCKRRGVKSLGMHALRHSFARGYIQNGGNAFKLQRLLTHSTLEMTKRYVRLFGDDLKLDYEQFSPLDQNMPTGRIRKNI